MAPGNAESAISACHGPSLMPPTVNPAATTSTCLSSPQRTVSYTIPASGTITAAAAAPGDIILTQRFLDDSSWPTELVLDLGKSNWPEWSGHLELLAAGQGFLRYLDGSLQSPDATLHPGAHWIWDNNDLSLRAVILRRISVEDYDIVNPLWKNGAAACAIFEALRSRHEPHAQVVTLIKMFNMRADAPKSLGDTAREIRRLHSRITKMGPIDDDILFSVFLINALGRHFPQVQSSILSMAGMPNLSSAAVIQQIHEQLGR